MPKKLDSVSLNTSCVNLIVNYCEKADISEAAFSRKFKKNKSQFYLNRGHDKELKKTL